jgi:hypothetical protein
MLVVRGAFFRDTTPGTDEVLPTVELSDKLWHLHQAGGMWTDAAP